MFSVAPLTAALYKEEVVRARRMLPADKLLEGPRLFERACRVMAEGIRQQHPELNDDGVRRLLDARLALVRQLEDLIVTKLRWARADAPRISTMRET